MPLDGTRWRAVRAARVISNLQLFRYADRALGQTVLVRQLLIFILVLLEINMVLAVFGSPPQS